MFCIKCGKQIEKGTLCNECLVAELVGTEQAKETPAVQTPVAQEPVIAAPTEVTATNGATIDGAGNFTFFNEQTNASAPAPECTSTMPEPQNRMYGFGKALASTIMSAVGFILAYIALFAAVFEPVAGFVLLLCSLPLIIISLIFGIQSIKVFIARKRTCVKPIPTLVLGIEGLATAAFSAFFAFIVLIIVAAVMLAA